jgi:soluble lytic murein transglycosylase-like protein
LAGALLLATGVAGVLQAAGPALKAGALKASALRASAVVRADPATGRLVRKVVAPSGSLQPETIRKEARIDRLVEEAARKYGVDPLLIHSVIRAESNYNPFAVSPKGAEGLMQLLPATARRFNVTNSFDVGQNIDAGVRYLKHLQDLFQDSQLALAAYNAGEGAVERYQRQVPPYRETQEYVGRVGETYGNLRSETNRQAGGQPQYRPLEAFVDSEGRLHLRTR